MMLRYMCSAHTVRGVAATLGSLLCSHSEMWLRFWAPCFGLGRPSLFRASVKRNNVYHFYKQLSMNNGIANFRTVNIFKNASVT